MRYARFQHLLGLAATSAVVLLATGVPAAAQPVEPVDDPSYTQLVADLAAFSCPTLAGMEVQPFVLSVGRSIVDGVAYPVDQIYLECRYGLPGDPSQYLRVNLVFDRATVEFPFLCTAQRQEDRSNPDNQRVDYQRLRDDLSIAVSYTIHQLAIALAPTIEADIVTAFTALLPLVEPLVRRCQLPPVQVTCPPIEGWTISFEEQAEPDELMIARCTYEVTDADGESRTAEIFAMWATERSRPDALLTACEDPGESPRPRVGTIASGVAAQATWRSGAALGTETTPVADAAGALLDQVVTQATTCDGVTIEPVWTPLPGYLADVFAPERIVAPPMKDVAYYGDVDSGVVPPTAGETTVTTPTAGTGAANATAPKGTWLTTAFRILAVVALVLSMLGVAIALLTVRKRSRIRPRFDVARIVIVTIVAFVSAAVLSKSAPAWAIAVAIIVGAVLGYVQGQNVVVTVVGSRLMATRGALAIVTFAAALIITQIAGLLDRSGAIALGIALSLLSAATTAGLVAGRKGPIAVARSAGAGAITAGVIAIVMLGTLLSSRSDEAHAATVPVTNPPAAPEVSCAAIIGSIVPGQRCAAHEHLIGLVDWTSIDLTTGLFASAGKPPAVMAVPRGLDAAPAPVTRTVAWSHTFTEGTAPTAYEVTETVTFALTADGLCCSIEYTGSGTQTRPGSAPAVWVADATLGDIQALGTGISGAILGLGEALPGLPFSERREVVVDGVAQCRRVVAETVAQMDQNAVVRTLTRDGQDLGASAIGEIGYTTMTTGCDLPGFTMEAAVAAAPPLAARDQRSIGCPARMELVPALADGRAEMTATVTIAEVFLTPHAAMCSAGSLVNPLQFGSGGKGGTRSEFAFEYAAPADATVWGDDDALASLYRPSQIPPAERCATDELGRALRVTADERCELISMHRLVVDPGSGLLSGTEPASELAGDGWIWIDVSNQHGDGPDVTIRASLPWGSYYYRCHHCEPDSPEIVDFLNSFHDVSVEWITTQDAAPTAPSDTGVPLPDGTTGEQAAEEGSVEDPDDVALAAAMAALIGLLGSVALAGTALAESGLSREQIASIFRRGGVGALNDALDAAAAGAVVDERGNVLHPDDDGLYEWDDGLSSRRVSRDELDELIASARQAEDERRARHEGLVAEMTSDEAADERLADLRARSQRADEDAREALRQELKRAGRADLTRERVAAALAERAAAGGWDAIAERLAAGDSLSREELLEVRAVLDRLTAQQGSANPATSGTYSSDLLAEFAADARSAATTAQEVAAKLAEVHYGPLGGWMVRNPVDAARIGLAVGTGGFSEGLITPFEVMQAMEQAAERAHAQGRDLTYGEALAAGAWQVGPGMVLGHLGELGIAKLGPSLSAAASDSFDTAIRRVDELLQAKAPASGAATTATTAATRAAETAAERSARLGALADEHGLHWTPKNPDQIPNVRALPEGTIVPQSRITSDYGMPMENYRQLRGTVERNRVGIEVRSTTAGAPDKLAAGALPKPEDVKLKTANEFDTYMGLADDVESTVPWRPEGWPEPHPKVVPDNYRVDLPEAERAAHWQSDGYPNTRDRWEWRMKEVDEYSGKIGSMIDDGTARTNAATGQLEMRDEFGHWQPLTGDHDLFRVTVEIPPGMPPDKIPAYVANVKKEVMAELSLPPFNVQHPAHIDWTPVTDADRVIDAKVLSGHTVVGSDALLAVHPGRPAFVTYSSGGR